MTDALFLLDTDHDNAPVLAEGIEEGWTIALPSQVKRHAISAMRLSEGDALQKQGTMSKQLIWLRKLAWMK